MAIMAGDIAFDGSQLKSLTVQQLNARHVGVGAAFHSRHVAWSQKRHGDTPCCDIASAVFDWNNQSVDNQRVGQCRRAMYPTTVASNSDKNGAGVFQAPRRVVVASRHDDIQVRHPRAGLGYRKRMGRVTMKGRRRQTRHGDE